MFIHIKTQILKTFSFSFSLLRYHPPLYNFNFISFLYASNGVVEKKLSTYIVPFQQYEGKRRYKSDYLAQQII